MFVPAGQLLLLLRQPNGKKELNAAASGTLVVNARGVSCVKDGISFGFAHSGFGTMKTRTPSARCSKTRRMRGFILGTEQQKVCKFQVSGCTTRRPGAARGKRFQGLSVQEFQDFFAPAMKSQKGSTC